MPDHTTTPVLSDDAWLDLAERHATADWNSDKPDGYLNAIKAVCADFAALPAAPQADECEIAKALRPHGLTLLRTADVYAVLGFGEIEANATPSPLQGILDGCLHIWCRG